MEKRKIIIGDYDTAIHGWTLAAWKLSPPVQKTNYVDKPGGDGSWDLSTVLTDGLPRYNDRTLTITLERSDGDRLTRKAAIRDMVNRLDGLRHNIVLPDDPTYYLSGRVNVATEYNDVAHAAVTVSAVCEPWLYSMAVTTETLTAATAKKTVTLTNNGRRPVAPTVEVSGTGANVTLVYGDHARTLSAGTYILPDLLLTAGAHTLTYSGTGSLKITISGEAVLE